MDKQLDDPARMASGLPKRRRRTAKEYQDIQVGRRGMESGSGATGQHRGQRAGEALSHDVPSGVDGVHVEQRAGSLLMTQNEFAEVAALEPAQPEMRAASEPTFRFSGLR